MDTQSGRRRILAISSGGGHWIQLLRIARALEDADVSFATVNDAYRTDVPDQPFYLVPDATRWERWRLLRMIASVASLVIRLRPEVVISTGAAPGCIALLVGRLIGARTIWLDSIANVEVLSMSGRLVAPFAGLRLTQWPHLATGSGPEHAGRVF